MKNNRKGFTLVEVLAAVTILGILSVTAVIGVTKIIENAKERHYSTAEEQLKLAGQSYVQQNRSALPKAIGQKTKIPLELLISKNFIAPIKDYSDNNCDAKKSYVQVFKYSQSDYSYVAYLDCPAYNSKKVITKGSPTINIVLSDAKKGKDAKADITIEDQEKLLSWSYIIYKNGEEIKNSGSTPVSNYSKEITKTLSLAQYTPGKIQVMVTATNIYGLTTTVSSDVVDYRDVQAPTCIIQPKDNKNNPKPWTKSPVTITVGCDDGDGSGCEKEEYTKTFSTTTDVGNITIQDKEGNKTTCEVSVNIDKTPPTCKTSGGTQWTKDQITLTGTCSDAHSGCETASVSKLFTEETKPGTTGSPGIVRDKLGNETICPSQPIRIDRTPPTCTVSGGSTTWTKNNRTVSVTCSDSGSGCKTTTQSDTVKTTTKQKTYTVVDNVGNTGTCKANIYVDKDAPKCGTAIGASDKWRNPASVTITQQCDDGNGSGCDSVKKTYTSDTKTGSVTIKDKVGNSRICSYDVYLDNTPPYTPHVVLIGQQAFARESETHSEPEDISTIYVKSASCSKNAAFSRTDNTCSATIFFYCSNGGPDGKCWVTYGFNKLGDADLYAPIHWEYSGTKYGDTNQYVAWNRDGFGGSTAGIYKADLNYRLVDEAGNISGTLKTVFTFTKSS